MKYILKDFIKKDISKYYIIGIALISLLLIGGYFSYAMFTVSKEKDNAISIITGNLTYKLEVDGVEGNILSIPGDTIKEFTVTLSNPNNRTARFNFYYEGSLDSNVTVGYKTGDGINTPPEAKGINLEKSGTSGSSNTYVIKVSNNTSSSKTITLGVQVGLDYNDLTLPSNGHLFSEASKEVVADYVLADQGDNGSIYDDGEDTFITGTNPNNYIWYSGKLWRAVSVNNEAKTTKLVTQWNISALEFSVGDTSFGGSSIEFWLNDTTVDGFLGNLRDYENFIVTDSVWNATMSSESTKPPETTLVTKPVGLINYYEYTITGGYLNNGVSWKLLTPTSDSAISYINYNGSLEEITNYTYRTGLGIRPSINLQSNVKIVSGDGTETNPYRIEGDNDSNLSGTKLNTRYSGEYISFGTGENTLYRIVSHETSGLTKITSAEPLKKSDSYLSDVFYSNSSEFYSTDDGIGMFMNNDYLNPQNGYLTSEQVQMIEDNNTWYTGYVSSDWLDYRLAKYTDTTMSTLTSSATTAKVGLLRFGELMAGQFTSYDGNSSYMSNGSYWILTPMSSGGNRYVNTSGTASGNAGFYSCGYRPALNLKSNVIITGGDGTKENPFQIELGS